uniref:Uncharacterized protein n=2 Tax=Chrysotila carterae TaxID=13221 RepID=A0A7S4C793_CHRCT|mmetsp:Transcript_6201/g.13544  ORF Transcript_6201/g.13544 Transcript_6201/m.13544 type:complete len:311 (+) Transcript_6201:399-1331(+)
MDSDRRSSAGRHVCCADGTGEVGGAAEGSELATGNGRDGEVPCAAGRRGHRCKESRSACDADDGGYERCESCESCESCGYSKRCERFGGGAGGVEEGKEDGSSEGRGGLHQRLRVSFLDWDLEASSVVVDVEETFSTEQGVKTQQQAEASAASLALSSLEPAEKFDLILASDVIYSSCHARRLPAVVGKRMSAGGRMAAMVPVRSESNSREFFDGLVAAGMHVRYALVDTDWVDHIVSLQSGASASSSRNKAVKAAPSERNKQQQRKLNAAPMLAYSHQAPLTEGSILFVHAEWAVNEARQQAKSDEFGR